MVLRDIESDVSSTEYDTNQDASYTPSRPNSFRHKRVLAFLFVTLAVTVGVAIGITVSYVKNNNKVNKELSSVIQEESTGPGGSASPTASPTMESGNVTGVTNATMFSGNSTSTTGSTSTTTDSTMPGDLLTTTTTSMDATLVSTTSTNNDVGGTTTTTAIPTEGTTEANDTTEPTGGAPTTTATTTAAAATTALVETTTSSTAEVETTTSTSTTEETTTTTTFTTTTTSSTTTEDETTTSATTTASASQDPSAATSTTTSSTAEDQTTALATTDGPTTTTTTATSTTRDVTTTESADLTTPASNLSTTSNAEIPTMPTATAPDTTAVATTTDASTATDATETTAATTAFGNETTASSSGGDYCINVEILTDQFGGETGYTLESAESGEVLLDFPVGSFASETVYSETVCVPAGTYRLTVSDGFRGLCCAYGEGHYAVSIDGNEIVRGGSFGTPTKVVDILAGYDPFLTDRDREWLDAHNSRRQAFHEENGEIFNPLVWSNSLAEEANAWLEELLPECKVQSQPNIEEGENLSGRSGSNPRSTEDPESILGRWVENQANRDWPQNQSFTQVMWRATRYLGCADKYELVTLEDGSTTHCYISVCRYARAGNCNVGKYDSWLIPTLADSSPCGPVCPSEGCY
mmetsp:Transcript_13276/g.25290  ORF Transcript_13276/g.25290 Transcript_13276/m.25290 type:complete len:640 (+) Transcript_13276:590-2509(+)